MARFPHLLYSPLATAVMVDRHPFLVLRIEVVKFYLLLIQSLALGGFCCSSILACSASIRLNNFPALLFGISFTNLIPPRSRLYGATFSCNQSLNSFSIFSSAL